MNLDLPAGDADLVDHKAKEALTLFEVERADAVGNLLGEVGDTLAETVAGGKLVALAAELDPLVLEVLATSVDLGGTPGELGHVDEPGLVEIVDPAPLGGRLLDTPVEAGQLGGKDLVVRHGRPPGDRPLAGEQDVGARQDVADLVEDEGVELVGAHVAFPAALVRTAGAERVAVCAYVVAVLLLAALGR